MAATRRDQRLGDLLAGTIVVREPPERLRRIVAAAAAEPPGRALREPEHHRHQARHDDRRARVPGSARGLRPRGAGGARGPVRRPPAPAASLRRPRRRNLPRAPRGREVERNHAGSDRTLQPQGLAKGGHAQCPSRMNRPGARRSSARRAGRSARELRSAPRRAPHRRHHPHRRRPHHRLHPRGHLRRLGRPRLRALDRRLLRVLHLLRGQANGGDLGRKKALNIRVIDAQTSSQVGYGKAFLRYLVRSLLSGILFLGYLWMLEIRGGAVLAQTVAGTFLVPVGRLPGRALPTGRGVRFVRSI